MRKWESEDDLTDEFGRWGSLDSLDSLGDQFDGLADTRDECH